MKSRITFFAGSVIIVLLVGFVAWYFGFKTASIPIGKILEKPGDYENKVISIKGEVTGRMAILALKYYTVKDNTGEIKVITKRALPSVGAKVTIKGKIKTAFEIGSLQEIVFVEEGEVEKDRK
ncbi:MAG: hypothetical protein ABIL39_10335 [candidate division WOR-3 bacterium]